MDACGEIEEIAGQIGDENQLNDKEWAKYLCQKATALAVDASDYLNAADTVVAADKINDKEWA